MNNQNEVLDGDLNRYHKKLKHLSNNTDNSHIYNILTFYKFTEQEIPEEKLQPLRDIIYNKFQELNIKGTILIAKEGINGTISCSSNCFSLDNNKNINNLDIAFKFLQAQDQLKNIPGKYSKAEFNPFKKLKIKVRPEIVTFKVGKLDVLNKVGKHVDYEEWNKLLEDPDTIVIDTRNDFEFKMGTFKNAINPNTKTFKDLPEFVEKNLDKNKNKKIAMFCTGGVRCEKSTSYMLEQGFEQVYHLNGGILKYFEDTNEQNSLWDGRCFIFDDRIAVDQNLTPVGIPEDYVNYGRRDLMPKDDEY